MHRLESEALSFDATGFPFSRRYGDVYASRDGALGQARHVFLAGNDLPRRWALRRQFVILETGFGVGTNFLATWQAWRNDPQRPQRLHFVSVELHPVRAQDVRSPAASAAPGSVVSSTSADGATAGGGSYDALDELRSQLAEQWPMLVPGLHRLEFDDAGVVLTLALGDALEMVSQLHVGVDAFYLDGFGPKRNPRMWDPRLFRALARLARDDATAATYTCARSVREALAANGFAVAPRPGFASKREMLSAQFAPRWRLRRHNPPTVNEGETRAIVVGAGLAGCSTVYALRRRGWHVTLVDRAPEAANGASGLPTGLLRPLLSADDNRASRLSRAGFLFALALLQRLGTCASLADSQALWAPCGVFEEAGSDEEAKETKSRLERDAWPADYALFLETQEATKRLGLAPRRAGTWFARGAVVAAARWCHALLGNEKPASMAPGIERIFLFNVTDVMRVAHGWRVSDQRGRHYEAPILVLANAIGLTGLPQFAHFPLQEFAGEISLLAPPALSELTAGVSGDGYLIPPVLGAAAVGASYEPVALDGNSPGEDRATAHEGLHAPPPRSRCGDAHRANLARMSRLLADPLAPRIDAAFSGRRCVSRDHLPLAGAVPDTDAMFREPHRFRGAHLPDLPRLPGLFCLTALGSRGLTLAPLLGEHIASLITGEPAPVETALAAAVDPARFLLRELR